MLTVLCFLWRGPRGKCAGIYEYCADDVNRLASMLRRHLSLAHEVVCCTDLPEGIDPAVRIVPLPPDALGLGGEYPKLFAFHPDAARLFGRRIAMIDLDSVIVADPAPLLDRPERFVAWAGRDGRGINTSLVLMDGGAFPQVWTTFGRPSVAAMRARGLAGIEQDWVGLCVAEDAATWPRAGAGIESYTANKGLLPETARIVFFNGRTHPRLCRRKSPWVAEHWR